MAEKRKRQLVISAAISTLRPQRGVAAERAEPATDPKYLQHGFDYVRIPAMRTV
jgi:hypothetical protein